jgi:predicted RNA-binding protein with RPS1 domain
VFPGIEAGKDCHHFASTHTSEIEVGKVYTGKVVSVTAFGAFMEVLPGKDGLIHVSELAEGRTENVEEVVRMGEVITAKCLGVDESGRVKMSRRAWLRDQKADQIKTVGVPAEARQPAKSGVTRFTMIGIVIVTFLFLFWWLNRDSDKKAGSVSSSSISESHNAELKQTKQSATNTDSLNTTSKNTPFSPGLATDSNAVKIEPETFRKSPNSNNNLGIIESPGNAKLIIGKWLERKYVTFYPDGTWTLQRNEEAPIEHEGRQWTLSGDKLTRTWPGGSIIERIDSLDRSEMKLSDEEGNVTLYQWVSAIPETKPLSDLRTPKALSSSVVGAANAGFSQSVPSEALGQVSAGAMPGERFPQTRLRVLNSVDIERISDADLRYAINEMFARHGASFGKDEVRRQFEPLSWYSEQKDLGFDEIENKRFSNIERSNLKLLGAIRDRVVPASLVDFNGKSAGKLNGVSFLDDGKQKGYVFRREKESRVSFSLSEGFPREGTIEFRILVRNGYGYADGALDPARKEALVFTTVGPDTWYPGAVWLTVCDNGSIKFATATGFGGERPNSDLVVNGTGFSFGEWHSIGISFGHTGRTINVDGRVVAKDDLSQALSTGGTLKGIVDQITIGEFKSSAWRNNQHDSGFEGLIERVRISKKQSDWVICK